MPDLGAEIRRALEGLWSSSAVLGSEKVAREFALSCSACGLPDGGLDVKGLSNFIFMIMLQDLMDPWSEFTRVLKPRGRVGLSDLTRSGVLPPNSMACSPG
jgi:hypothetical protein